LIGPKSGGFGYGDFGYGKESDHHGYGKEL
jgi:hypothetical protein